MAFESFDTGKFRIHTAAVPCERGYIAGVAVRQVRGTPRPRDVYVCSRQTGVASSAREALDAALAEGLRVVAELQSAPTRW